MSKERLKKGTMSFFGGVLDVIESATEAANLEREKNEKIEEAVVTLMKEYTGDRLVLVDKKD